ncbi:alpha/beta hydrolase [Paraburkholderia sp. MMS20-SJTR3]|uniref:Alpha/beta hydrolase n=1 Tax=Paraburkholderia sejongensis TaxID=2886946 RepID=A0ABS8JZ38_9BURK|nr:alpha/beta hydrolase [Paraburkholderia sp. MMS20-SJTR3]MCC8395177.1 alpha/beta hydrolase [Paraburkholderia sp. MMS20-SJTR3]
MTLVDTVKGMIGMDPSGHADADMKAVLDAFARLNPKPIEECSVSEAREQPTLADAAGHLTNESGSSAQMRQELDAVSSEDIVIPGAAGANPARVYVPQGDGPFPLVLYFHGGGWVLGDLDSYDETPRAMAARSRAIVVSAHYRQAPEHRLPAAHDDAFAAWCWLIDDATSLGGDPARLAVMGESAGGNLALNVSIRARDSGVALPVHQALIHPVATNNIVSLSYEENRNAKPLNKAMMLWFMQNLINSESDLTSPLLDVASANLAGLPPTAIVTAGIDPLRSDGETLAMKLREAGAAVEHRNYQGATHEFFGLTAAVQAARDAQAFVAAAQRAVFGQR